eukprot:TRINITY_DN3793_c0_g1_i1.p1 TRINITY_DN3793_c0_g1~~TRINITY_DN3793_c0_g1_i1.p1  ORF type:complete len:617 (-),score=94.05 TRINITY_DN3793_c0_g1_i1:103-1833(-)
MAKVDTKEMNPKFSSAEKVIAAFEKGGIDISDTKLSADKIVLLRQLTGDDKGSFGNVWEGRYHDAIVAVKVPKTQQLSPIELRDLLKEIAIWKSLPHPHIVLFMGACTEPGNFRIAAELMDGDLSDLIKRDSLTLLDLLDFSRQAALGMSWLHNNAKIIHRDLKPANIMYHKLGQAFTIKVGDFGLASVKKKDEITEIAGSPLYSAPEVLAGRQYSFPVDVYSFGICLWEIVTRGKEAYYDANHGGDFEKFKRKVIEGARPNIRDVQDVEGLRDLITECWDSDPKKRPTFSQVVKRLQDIQVNSAIRDAEGKNFWKQNFGESKQNAVAVNDFIRKLYSHINNNVDLDAIIEYTDNMEVRDRDPSKKYSQLIGGGLLSVPTADTHHDTLNDGPPNQAFYDYRCLVELFAPTTGVVTKPLTKDRTVTISNFGQILDWFGPLVKCNSKGKNAFLTRVSRTLKLTYFHGLIGGGEAARRLQNLPGGTFLVRFSGTAGFYVLSRKVSDSDFMEGRILYEPGKGFTVDRQVYFSKLQSFIVKHKEPLKLSTMCGGSQYKKLFNPVHPEPAKKKKRRKKKHKT